MTELAPRLPRGAVASIGRVALQPRLWPAALRQVRALAPRRWWAKPPFLPLPDRAWLGFRMTTAYGSAAAPVDPEDLVTWLEWTETVRRRSSGRAARTPNPILPDRR